MEVLLIYKLLEDISILKVILSEVSWTWFGKDRKY